MGLKQFSERRIKDMKLHNLIQKVEVTEDEELTSRYPESMPNLIEIATKDGRQFSKKITYPKGHPKNPMTDSEVEEKFKRLTKGFFSANNINAILSRLWLLEDVKGVKEMAGL